MNVKENLEEIDRDLCFGTYDNFKHLHDKEINRLFMDESIGEGDISKNPMPLGVGVSERVVFML